MYWQREQMEERDQLESLGKRWQGPGLSGSGEDSKMCRAQKLVERGGRS